MQGQAAAQSLAIIVPRDKSELYQSLRHAFETDATVGVTLDRRVGDRRAEDDIHGPERRRGDRRRRAELDAQLRAGRWIVVSCAPGSIDFRDPGARAILFLCCSHHVVPCQQCQNTYQLGWVQRVPPAGFACPLCSNDLTETVVAHAQTCRYWANHRTATTPKAELRAASM
jgi:hypothetical protein